MQMRDYSKVDVPRFAWNPQKPFTDKREVFGHDTETIKGYARLITSSDEDYLFADSFNDYAKYLMQKKYQKGLNFFYNLKYDYQAIFKHLPEKELRELDKKHVVEYNDYTIKFIPKKCVTIAKGHHSTKMFDIAQFYYMSLAKASKYVGEFKGDYDVTNMTEDSLKDPELLKYGLRDAYITGKLAQQFKDMVSQITSVRNYYSSASIGKRYLLTSGIKFEMNKDPKLLDMALKSYQGGRFETLQRGYFEDIYTYDINSAYPEQIVGLTSCDGKVIKNKEYEPDSTHSFFKCDLDIYNVMMSPMKWEMKGGLMTYPAGEFKGVHLTKKEYELISELGFPIKIIEAVHVMNQNPDYPFKFFGELYDKRKKLKEAGDNQQMVYKYIMNSIYGCFIQHNKQLHEVDYKTENYKVENGDAIFSDVRYKAGTLFNPIWASEITANTRVKLFEDFQRKANYIISIATDGVMLTKPIKLDIGENLGQYDYEKDKGVVIGSGVYQTDTKIRFRGFGRKKDARVNTDDNKMDIYKILNSNPDKTMIPFTRTRPRNMSESLIRKDLGKESINLFLEETRVLNLNFDRKRIWERPFDSARDCMESNIASVPHRM